LESALKQLGIIIVTYQSERYVGPLLGSLAATLDLARSVVWILDNASTDGTVAAIERENGALNLPLHLIRSERNLGFTGANNRAFAAMRAETPCETVVLLNPDTVVHAGWWQPLVAALDDPAVGTVAPLLLLPDGTVNSRGNALHFLGLGFVQGYGETVFESSKEPRGELRGISEVAVDLRATVQKTPRSEIAGYQQKPKEASGNSIQAIQDTSIFSGSGAALAFRAATIHALNAKLGGAEIFWEDLYLYAEDTDLGWRMRLRGLDNRLVAASRVTHDHRFWLDAQKAPGDRLFMIERNRYLLMLANFKWPTLALLLPWIIASELALGLGVWKLYPHRLRLWRAVWAQTRSPEFWKRRKRLQVGRRARDRDILRAMTGSIRHGALPFRPVDRGLDAGLRWSHRFLCAVVRW
jgi:GT2 family glycosyltransferase